VHVCFSDRLGCLGWITGSGKARNDECQILITSGNHATDRQCIYRNPCFVCSVIIVSLFGVRTCQGPDLLSWFVVDLLRRITILALALICSIWTTEVSGTGKVACRSEHMHVRSYMSLMTKWPSDHDPVCQCSCAAGFAGNILGKSGAVGVGEIALHHILWQEQHHAHSTEWKAIHVWVMLPAGVMLSYTYHVCCCMQ
jgi:hypothetical protein